jgi:hypothetical protein
VNNCAAGENFVGGRPASARSQSQSPHPKRVIGRPLAEPEALAPTSNRKRPQEGRNISRMDGKAKRRKNLKQDKSSMSDPESGGSNIGYLALWIGPAKSTPLLSSVKLVK